MQPISSTRLQTMSPPTTTTSLTQVGGNPTSVAIPMIDTTARKIVKNFFLSEGFNLYCYLLIGNQISISSTHPVGIRINELYTSNPFFRALSSDQNIEILDKIKEAFPNFKRDETFKLFLTKLENLAKSTLFIPFNTLNNTDEMRKIFSGYSEIDKKYLVQEWENSWEKLSSHPTLCEIFDDKLKTFCKTSLPIHFLNDILKHQTLFELKTTLEHYNDIIFTCEENPLFCTSYKISDFKKNLSTVLDIIIININAYAEHLFNSSIAQLTLNKEDETYIEKIREKLQDTLLDFKYSQYPKNLQNDTSKKIQAALNLFKLKSTHSYAQVRNLTKPSSSVDNTLGVDSAEIINDTWNNFSQYLEALFSKKTITILLESVPICFVDFLLRPFVDISWHWDNSDKKLENLKLSTNILNIIIQLINILHNHYDEPQLKQKKEASPQIQYLLEKLEPTPTSKNDLKLIITELQTFLIDKLNHGDLLLDYLNCNFKKTFLPFLKLLLQKELSPSTKLKEITKNAILLSYLKKENPHTWALLQSPHPPPVENNPLSLKEQLEIRVTITSFSWFIDVCHRDASILEKLPQEFSADVFQKEIQPHLKNYLKIKQEILEISKDSKLPALKNIEDLVEKIPFTSLDALDYCLEFITILKDLELITNQRPELKPELKQLLSLELNEINITSLSLEKLKDYSKLIKDKFAKINEKELLDLDDFTKLTTTQQKPKKPKKSTKSTEQTGSSDLQSIPESKTDHLHYLHNNLNVIFYDTDIDLGTRIKKEIEKILKKITLDTLSKDSNLAKDFDSYIKEAEDFLSKQSEKINTKFNEKYKGAINLHLKDRESKISEPNLKKIKNLLLHFYQSYTSDSQFSEFKTHFENQLKLITDVCKNFLVIFKQDPDFFNTEFSSLFDLSTTLNLSDVLEKLDNKILTLPSKKAPIDPPPPSASEENIKLCLNKLKSLVDTLQINEDQFSNLTQVITPTLSTIEDSSVFIKSIDLACQEIKLIKRLMKIPCSHDSRDTKWAELTPLIASSDSYDTFMSKLSKVSDLLKEFAMLILGPHVPEEDLTDELLTTLTSYLLDEDPKLHTILFNYTSTLYQVTNLLHPHKDYLKILLKIFDPESAKLANQYPELLTCPPKFNIISGLSTNEKTRILNLFFKVFNDLLTMDDSAKLAKINDYINKKRPELDCLKKEIYGPCVDLNAVDTLLHSLEKNTQLRAKLIERLKGGYEIYFYGSALTKNFKDIKDVDFLVTHPDLSRVTSEKIVFKIDGNDKEFDIHYVPPTYHFKALGRSQDNSILLKLGLDEKDKFIEQGYYSAHADLLKKYPDKIHFNSFINNSQDKTSRLYELLKRFCQIIEKNKDSLSSLEKTKKFFETKLIFDDTKLPQEFILIKNLIIEQFLNIDSNFEDRKSFLKKLMKFDQNISELKEKNALATFLVQLDKHNELAEVNKILQQKSKSIHPNNHQFFRNLITQYVDDPQKIPENLLKIIYNNLKAIVEDSLESNLGK
jgi:hypothetical protein